MKNIVFSIAGLIFLCLTVVAQVPEAFKYQAVLRDNSGNTLVNQFIGMKISIIPNEVTAQAIYIETFRVSTNQHGMVNIEIGKGTPELSTFAAIDWSAGPHFIEVFIDKAGGTNYVSLGVNPLLSVPYALYAKSAGNTFSGDYEALTNKPDLSKFITDPNDADADAANEAIQSIQLNGTVLEIKEGGKTFSLDLGPLLNAAYTNGLNDGKSAGYNDGMTAGYNAGYGDGYDDGHVDGYSAGYEVGYDDGFADGYGF
ncbi:MAG: hypothetical protein WA874_18595 [Chryseosolibacter sp.]